MRERALPLAGRRALVVGAGTPAGRAVAVALAEAGADVAVASATTDGEDVLAVRRIRRAVIALGRHSAEYAFDTTLGQNVLVSTRQVSKEMGGLDLLVNAQDAFAPLALDRTTDSDWTRTLALNLSGVFFACRAAAREMAAAGGAMLNVVRRPPGVAPAAYAAAKAGVVGLTQALAMELAGRGIGVNAIEVVEPEAPAEEASPVQDLAQLAIFVAEARGALTGQLLWAGTGPRA